MGPMLFLDLETTGMDPTRDHIIEIGCLLWEDGKIKDRFESLVNPCVPIPREITLLTGITDADVKTAPRFSEIKEKLFNFLGDIPIVGHNIQFDTSFLAYHHQHLKNDEIDTLHLARILLLREPSYALEVLMKKYKLPARGSHRAMADTETALSFFEFLLNKVPQIPEQARPTIRKILEKSTWAGKAFFGNMEAIFKETLTLPVEEISTLQQNAKPWDEQILRRFEAGEKILLESSRVLPIVNEMEPTCIAYGTTRRREEILSEAKQKNIPAAVLKESQFYLSPKKLDAEIESRASLGAETPFYLKMAIWNSVTKTGDREEISLEREEYGLFDTVCDSDAPDIYWERNREQIQSAKIALIHQGGFAQGIGKHLPEKFNNLIIEEASRLEDSFSNAHFTRFSERMLRHVFGNKATVFFGLLGIFYEHFAEEDYSGYLGNVILNEHARSSKHWQNVLDSANNLPEHFLKKSLLLALNNTNPNLTSWISSWNDEISFQVAPVSLSEIFHSNSERFKNILMHDEALSGDGSFSLIKRLFNLEGWTQIQDDYIAEINLHTEIPKYFPEPNTEGYFKKCLELFSTTISKQGGRAIFLVNSNKSVEAFYSALLPQCLEKKVKLLGVKVSGGTGKCVSLFLDDPNHSVLLATAQILPYLNDIGQHVDTVVFQKIAFDPPDNPVFKARSGLFNNGFNQYSLPRAAMKFRNLLNELNKQGVKNCHILDQRIRNREYGFLFNA